MGLESLKQFKKHIEKLGYGLLLIVVVIIFWKILPDSLFDDSTSTVVFDKSGELLGARISEDEQWRFPPSDSLPEKFKICIIEFEDRYFYKHPGINPFSVARAIVQNIKEKDIVSGASTLSMQVIRLSRKSKKRTISEKLIEMLLAVRMELSNTKKEILNLYASHAPFGGNVVGLETAAWRYFGRSPFELSWAESATLAVLPNAPSLIHPGKNRVLLEKKRNRLLKRIQEEGYIDSLEYSTAILEEIPLQPKKLPNIAYHLTEYFDLQNDGKKIISTIDIQLQEKLNRLVNIHKQRLYANQVRNTACIITDVETGNVLAYVGNIQNPDSPQYGGDVDVIHSGRSTGSILKPILYAEMQYRGDLLPNTIIADIPTRFRGYNPKNFNRSYDGVVSAAKALSRSLNVPIVRMLNQYGNQRFLADLKSLGFSTLKHSSEHYGLSLILGGAETSLWDLTKVYTSMSRVLNHYNLSMGRYFESDWQDLNMIKNSNSESEEEGSEQGRLGAGAIWLTYEALREVNRPQSETGWNLFSSSRKVAWKTGTSFGFRDAWAVASTPEYTISVWAGNASGEGRPGITGVNAAAPLLFDILNSLPETTWFEIPYDDLRQTLVCRSSGHKASRFCNEVDTAWVSPAGLNTLACSYHKKIHLDRERNFRVNANCYSMEDMLHENWFVLPPAQEWFYKQKHPLHESLPPLSDNCDHKDEINQIQIIYPVSGSILYVPNELDGKRGKIVFDAAHRRPETKLFWSIDEEFISSTKDFHQISVQPAEGEHVLTIVDEKGNRVRVSFSVVDR